MRKSFWIVLTLLLLAFLAPNAHADSYTVTFVCTYGSCITPTAPPVDSTNDPTLAITYDLLQISVPLPATFDYTASWLWTAATDFPSASTFGFNIGNPTTAWFGVTEPNTTGLSYDQAIGTLTFTPIATPEPSSLALILAGIGFVLALRKLIA